MHTTRMKVTKGWEFVDGGGRGYWDRTDSLSEKMGDISRICFLGNCAERRRPFINVREGKEMKSATTCYPVPACTHRKHLQVAHSSGTDCLFGPRRVIIKIIAD